MLSKPTFVTKVYQFGSKVLNWNSSLGFLVCSSASLNMKLYFLALVFTNLHGLKTFMKNLKKFMKFPQVELVDWSFFLMGASPSKVDATSFEIGAG
jgi:hypothetical protein